MCRTQSSCLEIRPLVLWIAFTICIVPISHALITDLNATAMIMDIPVGPVPWKLNSALRKVVWKQMKIGDISRLLDFRNVPVTGMCTCCCALFCTRSLSLKCPFPRLPTPRELDLVLNLDLLYPCVARHALCVNQEPRLDADCSFLNHSLRTSSSCFRTFMVTHHCCFLHTELMSLMLGQIFSQRRNSGPCFQHPQQWWHQSIVLGPESTGVTWHTLFHCQ